MFSVFQKRNNFKNLNETLRFYAQSKKAKEAKKAARSKDQLDKEKKKKDEKKKEEEKKAAKKMKIAQKLKEKAEVEVKQGYRNRFEGPPVKPYLPLPLDQFTSGKFKEYLTSYQNINFQEKSGFFGLQELSSSTSLKSYQTTVFLELERLLATKVDTMSGTEFIQYLKKIDFLLNDLLYKSQLAHTFLPTEEIVSQSVSIKILTEAFYEQNLVPLFDQFYKKLKQHEKELSSEDLLFLYKKLDVYEQRGSHLDFDEKVEYLSFEYELKDRKDIFDKSLKDFLPISIPSPTRLFELPKEIYLSVPKKNIQKKRSALYDNNISQEVIKYCSNKFIRQELAKKNREYLLDGKNSFHSNLKIWIQKASDLTKSRGIENYSELRFKEDKIWAPKDVKTSLLSFVNEMKINNYVTSFLGKEHQKYDFQLLENQRIEAKRQYNKEAIQEFFSLASLFDSIDSLSQKLFGIQLKEEKLKVGETWNPKYIKKFTLVEGDKTIGTVYLDLFENEKTNKPKTINATYGAYSNIAILSSNLKEGVYGYPTLLSHETVAQFLKTFSEIIYNLKSKNSNPLIKDVFTGLFNYYSTHPQFLKSFSHYAKNTPLFEEYMKDLAQIQPFSYYQLLREATYAISDLELFGGSTKNTEKILKEVETNTVGDQIEIFPHLNEFKDFGGKYYQKLYTKMITSQIWNEKLKNGTETMDFNLFFQNKHAKEILKDILGSEEPNYKFLIKDVSLN